MPITVCVFLWLGLVAVRSAELAPAFTTPDTSPLLTTEGKAALVWEIDGAQGDGLRFELQQSDNADFSAARTRYQGIDRGTFISGLPEGDYYYRVRTLDPQDTPGPWSDAIEVQVRYAPATLVIWLSAIGIAVFVATVFTVLKGHCQSRPAGAPGS